MKLIVRTIASKEKPLIIRSWPGELAILDSGPRSATVSADDEVVCHVLSEDAFAALSANAPAVAIQGHHFQRQGATGFKQAFEAGAQIGRLHAEPICDRGLAAALREVGAEGGIHAPPRQIEQRQLHGREHFARFGEAIARDGDVQAVEDGLFTGVGDVEGIVGAVGCRCGCCRSACACLPDRGPA